MNAGSTDDRSPQKQTRLPGILAVPWNVLRLFWITFFGLLVVVVIGLWSGWSAQRQWSDGIFWSAAAQIIISFVIMRGSTLETGDSASLRYLFKGDVAKIREEIVLLTLHKQAFGLRTFIGGLLTIVIAMIVSKV